MFSRTSKVACLIDVFSAALCFMQVITHIEENTIQRLNKLSKLFQGVLVYLSYQFANKRTAGSSASAILTKTSLAVSLDENVVQFKLN